MGGTVSQPEPRIWRHADGSLSMAWSGWQGPPPPPIKFTTMTPEETVRTFKWLAKHDKWAANKKST